MIIVQFYYEISEYESEISESAAILERSLRAADAPAKIVWLLAHQYSPAGLSFSALKAADAAQAGVLVQAAARALCVAHLGIVHIGELGAAEPDFDAYSNGSRWNRCRYDDEDGEEGEEEEEGDDAGGDFTVVTVDDAWRYIDEWRDTGDRAAEFGPIPLAKGELLPEGALDRESPDRQKLMEASGNEGASYERSYHRAALVLWRQDRYAEVLLQAGVVAGLPYLKQLTAGGKRARLSVEEPVGRVKRRIAAATGRSARFSGHFRAGADARVAARGQAGGGRHEPARRRTRVSGGGSGYPLRRWSNSKAGAHWSSGAAAGSCSALVAAHSGGPRAGAMRGGAVGSRRWPRMSRTVGPSVMKAMMCIAPPPAGHSSGKTP